MDDKRLLKPKYWISNYSDFLKGYAIKMVPLHLVEDLVQETFLSALKSAPFYKGNSTERTWLVGILRHKIMDYYRGINTKKALTKERAIRPENFNAYVPIESNPFKLDSSNPETYIILDDLVQILEEGFESLSENESRAIKLKINGMNTNQICDNMNINRAYCWLLISKARRKLRIFLEKNWESGLSYMPNNVN
ncbi:RNA polymerase sigma factor [Allomuricauda sp. SCSIO 65647]|uniref:RNA polymerase sigma factor n=1 Tax=Allomuricauda sp. SCSIO 65647 TaxID=2908843 RepID=UPI001F35AA31|nr:sigma-70 family RNA polymerase sigma factor [Muricauda sp. SCSIO 65647]UJH68604.1 sigma-70 family RNA polymerase sigma factor [Muricauda sp. SCSIO 65647]